MNPGSTPTVPLKRLSCTAAWFLALFSICWPAENPTSQTPESVTPNTCIIKAGKLELVLHREPGGVRMSPVRLDPSSDADLQTGNTPIFDLEFNGLEDNHPLRINSDTGWAGLSISSGEEKESTEILWSKPKDSRFQGISVRVDIRPDQAQSCLIWDLEVQNDNPNLTLRSVVFPQVSVSSPGPDRSLFFPRGPGVAKAADDTAFEERGTYPNGWTTMQFMAVYGGLKKQGFYLGMHDPWGSLKDLSAKIEPDQQLALFSMTQPVPDATIGGNDFHLPGEAVWSVFQGDWFDASRIYRAWVRENARWMPPADWNGREDTPLWMRRLPLWVLGGGPSESAVPAVRKFAEYMDLPIGFHWYNWHQIPFDNDYPHYFPAKERFQEGVQQLQSEDVYVMPYINGRLWDTHDHGAEDQFFSSVALPAATKKESGEPYTESYGSKETNGDPVQLAPMCPATGIWQLKVREIVLRLFNKIGVKGVYVDQIAAAKPMLCFDPHHGHPLGGGHWWNEGYWELMENLQNSIPEDAMLTTECNAEPFIRWFDGYLTWHWQFQDQVPAFPAIYGGSIQMFGRAYRGGPTQDLALRMKAGQQLVFGEQIGWIGPEIIDRADTAAFLKKIATMRWQFSRYFDQGVMERPPRLLGEIPPVTADWQWSGEWLITTAAVQTGAWRIPEADALVLFFVNVGMEPVDAKLELDLHAYGLSGASFTISPSSGDKFHTGAMVQKEITFIPDTPVAWEIRSSGNQADDGAQ